MKRKALGRGLSALLAETPVETTEQKAIIEIPLDSIEANYRAGFLYVSVAKKEAK